MICTKIHDSLHDLFNDVSDPKEYISKVKASYAKDNWSMLMGVSNDRDIALTHVKNCSDCLDDLLLYLEIKDVIDYRDYPCLHLAYYSINKEFSCIKNHSGFFTILGKGDEVGIGFCPWCGICLPVSFNEMDDAKQLGFKEWQRKNQRDCGCS